MQLRFASAFLAGVLVAGTPAQGTTIAPTSVELVRSGQTASVTISNSSAEPLVLQASAFEWLQVDGQDRYVETDAIMVAPPIATIAPRAQQVIRVRLRTPYPAAEQAYRLMLEDISPNTPGKPGVSFRINHNLPVMVSVPGATADPVWSRCAAPAGKLCLRVDNRGNRRVRISQVRLSGGAPSDGPLPNSIGQAPLNIVDTVLAGSWKQWVVDAPATARQATQVSYRTESGEASAELPR